MEGATAPASATFVAPASVIELATGVNTGIETGASSAGAESGVNRCVVRPASGDPRTGKRKKKKAKQKHAEGATMGAGGCHFWIPVRPALPCPCPCPRKVVLTAAFERRPPRNLSPTLKAESWWAVGSGLHSMCQGHPSVFRYNPCLPPQVQTFLSRPNGDAQAKLVHTFTRPFCTPLPPLPRRCQRKSRFCKFEADLRADQPLATGRYCRLHLVEEKDRKDTAGEFLFFWGVFFWGGSAAYLHSPSAARSNAPVLTAACQPRWTVTPSKAVGGPPSIPLPLSLCDHTAIAATPTGMVPCPLDGSHCVAAHRLDRHLKICPVVRDRTKLETEPFFSVGCNAGHNRYPRCPAPSPSSAVDDPAAEAEALLHDPVRFRVFLDDLSAAYGELGESQATAAAVADADDAEHNFQLELGFEQLRPDACAFMC